MLTANRYAYSAEVRASLRVAGHEFNVAQVGNGYCILRDAHHVPPCVAELRLSIDGEEQLYRVRLEAGIDPAITRTVFQQEAMA